MKAGHLRRAVLATIGRVASCSESVRMAAVDELLEDLKAGGLPLDPEPPTLPTVKAEIRSVAPNGDAIIGSSRHLTSREADFAIRLLNALPRLRGLADGAMREVPSAFVGQTAKPDRLVLEHALRDILAILNDEVKP